jgi:hypothetical protein
MPNLFSLIHNKRFYAIKKTCTRASSEDRVFINRPGPNEACVEAVENVYGSGAFVWTELVVEKERNKMIRNSVLIGQVVGLKDFVGTVVADILLELLCCHSNGHLGQARRENQVSLEWSRLPWLGHCLTGNQERRF